MSCSFRTLYSIFQPQLRSTPYRGGTVRMHPPIQADQTTRRAQVVEALADAVATMDRAPRPGAWPTTWAAPWPAVAAAAAG
jgi:hypothetical protein